MYVSRFIISRIVYTVNIIVFKDKKLAGMNIPSRYYVFGRPVPSDIFNLPVDRGKSVHLQIFICL